MIAAGFSDFGLYGLVIGSLFMLLFLMMKLLDKRYSAPSNGMASRIDTLVSLNTQQIETQKEHTKSVSDLTTELRVGFATRPTHEWIGEYIQKKNIEILQDCRQSIQSHIKDHLLEYPHDEKKTG